MAAIQAYYPPLPPPASASLADLEPGAAGVVIAVEAADAVGRRLLDLGFVPDTPVRALRRAPLGDPVEYELRGCRFCLRRAEARRIQIRQP